MSSKKLIIRVIENWPVKVLSIALALVLFVINRMNTMTTRPLSIPLLVETNSSLIPASPYPQTVRITLRGEDEGIKSISDRDIEAYVDLTRYDTGGLYSAPIQIRKMGIAQNVEPLEMTVNPLKISVQLDQRMSKTLPLTAIIQGRAADGFDFVSHSISPQEIVVTGPLSLLESVSEIKTDPVDLDGRSSNFITEVKISSPNPFSVLKGGEMASISCIIRPSVLVRSIDNIPITLIGLKHGLKADIGGKTGSIRIEGSEEELDSFQPSAAVFIANCSGINGPGAYTLAVEIDLSPGFSLIRHEPEELSVIISLAENTEDL